MQLDDWSAVAAVEAVKTGEVSAVALASRHLDRILSDKGGTGSVRQVMAEQALQHAAQIDIRRKAKGVLPALAGLPVLVKENCDVRGAACSAGLQFRSGHVPDRDSWIAARLRELGAVILGVAISDPGAFSVRTAEVTHPSDPALTVGGSSGGSAAALAAGLCLGAIGTDTGGSIRIPSACCGTAGLKPTYGRLPMDGIFPLVHSLDHVGPMAGDLAGVQLMWHALSGSARPEPHHGKLSIAHDPAWIEEADPAVREAHGHALGLLRSAGAQISEVRLPNLDAVSRMHGDIFLVEAAAWHCARHPHDIEAYPQIARTWFDIARTMQVGAYVDACRQRVAMTAQIDAVLADHSAILVPTLPVSRTRKDAATVRAAGRDLDFTMGLVRFTSLFDHTGHPVACFPVKGHPDPLAAGMQLVGRRMDESRLMDIAALLA